MSEAVKPIGKIQSAYPWGPLPSMIFHTFVHEKP